MMKYKGYMGQVELDAEAGILHGQVVGIRDVVTFQGESVKEVEQAFHDSVDDYLAFCKEQKQEPDKPCSGKFVVRLDSSLHRELNMWASEKGESLNTIVVERLQEAVKLRSEKIMPKRSSSRRSEVTHRSQTSVSSARLKGNAPTSPKAASAKSAKLKKGHQTAK